jgi:hypothetical protein
MDRLPRRKKHVKKPKQKRKRRLKKKKRYFENDVTTKTMLKRILNMTKVLKNISLETSRASQMKIFTSKFTNITQKTHD